MDRYEEAPERAKKGLPIDEVFPGLKETKDERIKREIIEYIEAFANAKNEKIPTEWLDWLEKQKEQKPAEWSEEDERMLSRCIKSVECSKRFANSETYKAAKDVEMNWLKDLSERFNLQLKQEWSEKDKEMFGRCIANAKKHIPIPDKNGHLDKIEERVDKELVDWLKERFFNLHWKPSEEQMKCLDDCVNRAREVYNASTSGYDAYHTLRSLYHDLQKLL